MGFADDVAEDLDKALKKLTKISINMYRDVRNISEEYRELIFTGSGDSYAAALSAHYIYSGPSIYGDPLTLLSWKGLERCSRERCLLIAISIGGRTISVVMLARKYRSLGGDVLAVTGSRNTPLGETASFIAEVPYTSTVHGVGIGRQILLETVLAEVVSGRSIGIEDLEIIGGDCPEFDDELYVGSGPSLGSAYYTLYKCREIYACRGRATGLEELIHAEIFGGYRGIYIFKPPQISKDLFDRFRNIVDTLRDLEADIGVVESHRDPWITVIGQKIHIAKCLARQLRIKPLDKPKFLEYRGLKTLTDLIYYRS